MRSLRAFTIGVFVLFASLGEGSSQNLVPNGGFEKKSGCPQMGGYWPQDIDKLLFWKNPLDDTSPDYQHKCNPWFPKFPRTDSGYVGLGIYYTDDYREYVTVPLERALDSGEGACLRFYVRKDSTYNDSIFGQGSPFGASFTTDTSFFDTTSIDTLSLIPEVEYTGPPILSDSGWVKISGSFTAAGGEAFMTLGNFRANSNTTATDEYAYYDFDDVTLFPTAPQGLPSDGDTTVCRGDSVRLSTAAADTVPEYSWSPDSGLGDTTRPDPLAHPDSTTTYTVTKRTCCDTVTRTVTVRVLDSATMPQGLPSDSSLCRGDSIRLTGLEPRAVSE